MNTTDHRFDIGKKVRRERLRHGLTQEELAEKAEMSASFIGQVERGVKAVSIDTLERLSRVFGLKSADFLRENNALEPRRDEPSLEHKMAGLLKGYSLSEQKVVYQTLKFMLRQNRKLSK